MRALSKFSHIAQRKMSESFFTEQETALFLVNTQETKSTWIPSQHCCTLCHCVLSFETKLYFTPHEQWFCKTCAFENKHNLSNLEIVSENVTRAILQSNDSPVWSCGMCNNFEGVTKQIMHYHTCASNCKRQILLGGRFIDAGFGNITPRLCKSSCLKLPTLCRFCNKALPTLGDWPFHIMTECTKVPCILSIQCVQDGILDYVDRIAAELSTNVRNLSSLFKDVKDCDYCKWGTCKGDKTTWKGMLRHFQQHGNDSKHRKIKKVLSDLREFIKSDSFNLKRKQSEEPQVSGKSPRLKVGTPNVIICGKKHP